MDFHPTLLRNFFFFSNNLIFKSLINSDREIFQSCIKRNIYIVEPISTRVEQLESNTVLLYIAIDIGNLF